MRKAEAILTLIFTLIVVPLGSMYIEKYFDVVNSIEKPFRDVNATKQECIPKQQLPKIILTDK